MAPSSAPPSSVLDFTHGLMDNGSILFLTLGLFLLGTDDDRNFELNGYHPFEILFLV